MYELLIIFFLIRQLMSSEPEVFERTPPDPVVNLCIRNTVEAIIPRLKDFHQILLHPPQVKFNIKLYFKFSF